MERMTDEATKRRRELEHELTLTMTAQVSYMMYGGFIRFIRQ